MHPHPPSPSKETEPLPRMIGRKRLLMVLMSPILALMAFGGYVVHEKLESYRHSAALLTAAQLAQSAHALARELQEERRVSALFIGAGRNQWEDSLGRQRANTDGAVNDFRRMLGKGATRTAFGRQPPQPQFGDIDALRAEVDGDADLKTVLNGYGGVISTVMAASSRLPGSESANLITAYTDLGNIKDHITRQRSLGDALLLNSRDRAEILPLLAESHAAIQAFIDSFRSHTTRRQGELFDRQVPAAALARVDALYAQVMAGRLHPVDAPEWENAHTALAGMVDKVEDDIAHRMDVDSGASLADAKVTFYTVLAVVLALVVFAVEILRRSERRAALAEEAAHKLLRAVEQSPVSVTITDTDGIIDYVNPAFCSASGYTLREMMGRNPRILKSGSTSSETYAGMWRTIHAGQQWRGEICNRRKDGSLFWVSATISPVRASNGEIVSFIAFEEDITEVKDLRQALEREHENVRRILETIRDGIALIGPDHSFTFTNPAFAEEFGTIDGRTCWEYFGDRPPPFCSDGDAMTVGERREWLAPQGKTYEVTATPVHTPDGLTSSLRVFHDITTRKRAEEAMVKAREAAELANRAKTEFLAAMSHELRTPLNAIIGFSEIMAEEILGPMEQPQYLEYCWDINRSGRHLLSVIEDILDVARIEMGKVQINEAEIHVPAILESAVAMVRERAKEKKVALTIDGASSLPPLWADARRLKQILFNVLGNAVKFTPEGGNVRIFGHIGEGGALEIGVTDTGIGIAAEDFDKVMEPFGQADSGMARRYEGTGLGLSLARELMGLHGGELLLDSALGQGTTVTLRFPAERLRSHPLRVEN